MTHEDKNLMEQILEIDGLRLNLREVEETLLAIRSGEVDALVIRGGAGEQVRALQGAEHPFRALVDAMMNEGAVLLDVGGLILYSNRRFAEMVGKEPGDIVGLRIVSFLSPTASEAGVDPVVPTEVDDRRRREITLVRSDGRPVEVRVTVSRFHVDGVTLLCLVATDLADERRMERIAAAERRAAFLARAGALLAGSIDYEAIVESVARISVPVLGDWCWVHLLEEGGEVRLLAVAHRDPEKVQFSNRLHEKFPPTRENAPLLHQVLESGEPVLSGQPDDASALRQYDLGSVMIVPLSVHGRVLGAMSFARERCGRPPETEDLALAGELATRAALAVENARLYRIARRTNEELEKRVRERTIQLEESVRELEAFTYTVAHDLRAPLRAIAGCSDLIVQEFGDVLRERSAVRDYFDRMTSGARKMDALINDLLSFSRLGRADLRMEVVPLDGIVAEARDRLEDEVAESGGEIRVDLPLPRIRAHRTTLVQVLVNLLSNALKFVAPGVRPEVRISAVSSGDTVKVSVRDNGIGINPVFRERIFGVFERLNQSERYPGTGIGLAIVRRAMERMGGRCGMESVMGKGSCFWIELPGEPSQP